MPVVGKAVRALFSKWPPKSNKMTLNSIKTPISKYFQSLFVIYMMEQCYIVIQDNLRKWGVVLEGAFFKMAAKIHKIPLNLIKTSVSKYFQCLFVIYMLGQCCIVTQDNLCK